MTGQGLGLVTLGNIFPAYGSLKATCIDRGSGQNALVLVRLLGGNDGLNTVVPFTDDLYYRLRPTLAIDENQIHKLNDTHGLHPACLGLQRLFLEGNLAIIQNVGYTQTNRSHFGSSEIWETGGSTEHPLITGWLGRYLDATGTSDSLNHDPAALYFSQQKPLSLSTVGNHRVCQFGQATLTLNLTNRRLASETNSYRTSVNYPNTRLGHSLRNIASMIASEIGTRIYHVTLSGFDTHSHQANPHHNLLKTLSDGLVAFQRDLQAKRQAHRVLTMTYSEFGRQAAENEMRGTDHGAAAPMFILGAKTNGGVHGSTSILSSDKSSHMAHGFDHRQVYATITEKWLGQRPPMAKYAPMPLLDFI